MNAKMLIAVALILSAPAVLAGDPHRVFEIPNMYAQGHLACADFDVIGLTVPGVPGFPHFAHNGRVAWCVTHAFVDIHDLYIERFDAARQRAQETVFSVGNGRFATRGRLGRYGGTPLRIRLARPC